MVSLTQWTWVGVDYRSWWWTGRPGVLRFMGSQRVGHDWATELNWKYQIKGMRHFLGMTGHLVRLCNRLRNGEGWGGTRVEGSACFGRSWRVFHAMLRSVCFILRIKNIPQVFLQRMKSSLWTVFRSLMYPQVEKNTLLQSEWAFFLFCFWPLPSGLLHLCSPNREQSQVPAVKVPSPNHWTTRELLELSIQWLNSILSMLV